MFMSTKENAFLYIVQKGDHADNQPFSFLSECFEMLSIIFSFIHIVLYPIQDKFHHLGHICHVIHKCTQFSQLNVFSLEFFSSLEHRVLSELL